jgi:23S rRNA pseudouridine1911/1915/1917 synthase
MVVHPAAGNYSGTLVNALMFHSQSLANVEDEHAFRPGIVHRIDKDTSGLLMVAKTDNAHASLSEQLFNKTIKRRYVAIVHGTILEDEGEIIAPIGRDPKNRKKMLVTATNSKNAETDFFVIERFTNYSLIECQLKTGRTHQIRVHMKYIGHPLVGDPVYGPKTTIDTSGQALHAKILGFIHPTTSEYMEFEAPLPKEFVETLNKIKGE